MSKFSRYALIALVLLLTSGLVLTVNAAEKGMLKSSGGWAYQVKLGHPGDDVTPTEAMQLVLKDDKHTFIVDVRTRPEYNFVGHPTVAYHVPSKLWTGEMIENKGKKAYKLVDNPDFAKDLLARFNPETDTLIFMCRSGKRSCQSADKAIKAGFKPDKIFNMLGGFEGDKVHCKVSAFNGQRKLGGWKNEGLPWSYSIDSKRAYDAFQAK